MTGLKLSHGIGKVFTLDQKCAGFFDYNGTGDFANRRILNTQQELMAHWRCLCSDCNVITQCECSPTPVILYTSYGGGFYWKVVICLSHKQITSGTEPDESFKSIEEALNDRS